MGWGQGNRGGRQEATEVLVVGRTQPRVPRGTPTRTLREMVWTAPHSHPLPGTEIPSFPIPQFGGCPKKR